MQPRSGNRVIVRVLAELGPRSRAQVYSGGSVGGAALMNQGKVDICLNWAGARRPLQLRGLPTCR